jgi:hypothetical protein
LSFREADGHGGQQRVASRGWLFGARGRKHAVDTAAAAHVRLSQTADVPLIVDG